MSANSKESFAFILCLLCFAVAASGYVLYHGLEVRLDIAARSRTVGRGPTLRSRPPCACLTFSALLSSTTVADCTCTSPLSKQMAGQTF